MINAQPARFLQYTLATGSKHRSGFGMGIMQRDVGDPSSGRIGVRRASCLKSLMLRVRTGWTNMTMSLSTDALLFATSLEIYLLS